MSKIENKLNLGKREKVIIMAKYNVDLEFTAYDIEVEADNEQDAIRQALIKLTNNPYDFFTAEDHYADIILNNFNDLSDVKLVEEDE